MALIHEGIGQVIYDPKGEFGTGTRVVMIPNTPQEDDDVVAENYRRSSIFRASGSDGFMQDIVAMRRDRVVVLPDWIDERVAAFTELVSVVYHAIDRFCKKAHSRQDTIAVWGDGNLAYIATLLLKNRLPQSRIIVVGKHEYKLKDFVFADETYTIDSIPAELSVDHAFECVGGAASSAAINQIIDYIRPEGSIAIMGVSEENVPVNTRMVLEKGLSVFGNSRSGVEDFKNLIAFYEENPTVVDYLKKIVGEIIEVHTIDDMVAAFDSDMRKKGGKTIMLWNK